MRTLAPALAVVFALGCDSPAPIPEAAALKPIAMPTPKPAPAPAPPPLASPVAPQAPEAPAPKFSIDAAPGKFVLNEHHRVFVDRFPALPSVGLSIEVSTPLEVEYRQDGDLPSTARPRTELPMFLFTPAATGLSVQRPGKKFRWPGGVGWLVGLRSAVQNMKVVQKPMAWSGSGKGTVAPEASVADVEASSQFRVRSLAGANTWSLKVTAVQGEGRVVVPALLQALPRPALTEMVWLDGKPLDRTMAVVGPGTHQLFGAAEAWFTVPVIAGLKALDLEVELTALPEAPDVPVAQRLPSGGRPTFTVSGPHGGRYLCERITNISPLDTVAGTTNQAFKVEFADEPALLVTGAAPKDLPTGAPSSGVGLQPVLDYIKACQLNRRSLKVGRMKRSASVQTPHGTWSGTRIDRDDMIYD